MAKKYAKYYQKCDFCHRELEVANEGMASITLPGYYLDSDGYETKQWITADICHKCKERLCDHLAKALDIREFEYVGTAIHWLNEKGERGE